MSPGWPKSTPVPDESSRPDLSRARRVHVIGAGGSGMSAISIVLMAMGHQVTGSDAAESETLRHLEGMGAAVRVGHDPAALGDADLVVRSTAIPDDNPEVLEAERRGMRIWSRSELLAAICAERRVVAVSGTHGKTTTSTLLYLVLREGGMHPSMVIGGDIAGVGPGAAWDSEGEWMVVEADESDGTFLALGAEAVLVTSVEPDHLEFYGDRDSLVRAFERFVALAEGPTVVCADDAGSLALASTGRDVITYGTDGAAQVRILDVSQSGVESAFRLQPHGRAAVPVSLHAPGLHNVRNAAGALTLANALGVRWEDGAMALKSYRGVARRFQLRGERGGVSFVDDYAHLPGEVSAVLAAARGGDWQRIVAVFQPHRYSRTEALWADFADAFQDADVLVITGIYPAGEAPREGVSGEQVYAAVRQRHPDADVRYQPTLDDVATELTGLLRPGDLCLTIGAGDVTKLADRLMAWEGESC